MKYLVLLASTPLLMFVLQMGAVRISMLFRSKVSSQLTVIICSLIGYIFMGAAIWLVYFRHVIATPYEFVWAGIYGLVVYNALAYGYFHIFNMSETSRRIRILYEIYASKQINASEIASLYNTKHMLNERLERLLSTKQIKQSGNRYLLDHRLLYYAARVVAWWGRILGSAPPEIAYDKPKE
jgi:hypothetical protein